jgi:hypothetical protein
MKKLGANQHESRMRPVDWAALGLLVFEIPSVFFSQYRANSLHTSEATAAAGSAYLLARWLISRHWQAAWLAGMVSLGGSVLAGHGISQFFSARVQLQQVGLSNLTAFRTHLLHPIPGWLPGESFTLLLLCLPFGYGLVLYLWRRDSFPTNWLGLVLPMAAVLLIAGALCLSLSRAVFWSTILFCSVATALLVSYRVIDFKRGSVLLLMVLGSLSLVLALESILWPGIFKTYFGTETSQVRSTHGRFEIWHRSAALARSHPFWGIGSSNAALFLLSTTDQEETTGFASRSFSLPVQIFVEKGIIGLALYAAFLVLFALDFHCSLFTKGGPIPRSIGKSRRGTQSERFRMAAESGYKAMKCCFAAGLVAVIFRELTYSSLFEHAIMLVLVFILAALACRREEAIA